jgi:sugar (pentulose or hexulose) kinase
MRRLARHPALWDSDMYILALDIGITAVKAAVLDVSTAAPATGIARLEYAVEVPTPEAAEVPTQRLWQTVAAAAREATRTAPDVQAVGMAVLTPGLVLLGRNDRPLAPIWTHLDRRARLVARQVWQAVGPEFLATTGSRPLPGGITVIGYRQQLIDDPYLSHRVHRYLHVNGWLGLHMTGDAFFDGSNASCSGLYGTLTDRAWSPRWCDYFEVDPAWLPPVVCGSATIGHVRAAVAAELGITAGIPVKLGTADISSAMLAAGMQPGDLLHWSDATHVLAAFTDLPSPGPEHLTRLLGVGDRYIAVTHNPVGVAAIDWIHQLCFSEQDGAVFYGPTLAAARARETRVTLDPPFLAGERMEIEAQRGAFRDLTLSTDRIDLLAAVLDAFARGQRKALAAVKQGHQLQRVFMTGASREIMVGLLHPYPNAEVHWLEEATVRGIARLF